MTLTCINQTDSILGLVRRGEVGTVDARGYGVLYGYNQKCLSSPLVQMSIEQVLNSQADWKQKFGSSAAGGYQVLRKTLACLVSEGLVYPTNLFNSETQDLIGYFLLVKRGLQKFLTGYLCLDNFAAGLAKEWASLPVLRDIEIRGETIKRGESYYGKTGMNVARITPHELESALKSMRSSAN